MTPVADHDRLNWWRTLALGVYLAAIGLLLLGLLISVWPAVEKASRTGLTLTPKAAAKAATADVKMSFFGLFHMNASAGTSLIVLVAIFGAIGSFIHAATSFVEYVGNRELARSWSWWYVLRIPIGSSLALIMYFAFRGGLFATTATTGDVNAYGVAALAGVSGLFSKQATAKLEELFSTLFKVDPDKGDARLKDGLGDVKPIVTGTEPAQLTTGGDATLEVVGSGFVEASQVSLKRTATGDVLEGRATFVDATRLRVALKADELAEPGTIEVTVVNPPPGGGTSDPVTVEVNPPAGLDPGADPAGPDPGADPAGPDPGADPAGPDPGADPAGPDPGADPAGGI